MSSRGLACRSATCSARYLRIQSNRSVLFARNGLSWRRKTVECSGSENSRHRSVGRPSMCSVVSAGSGSARSCTMSQLPDSMNSSMHWLANRSIAGSSFAIAGGVNSGCMILRYFWNIGGSVSIGIERWPTFFLAGMVIEFADEKVMSSSAILRMSSYLVTTQNPPYAPVCATGQRDRRSASTGQGSAANSGEWWSKSTVGTSSVTVMQWVRARGWPGPGASSSGRASPRCRASSARPRRPARPSGRPRRHAVNSATGCRRAGSRTPT